MNLHIWGMLISDLKGIIPLHAWHCKWTVLELHWKSPIWVPVVHKGCMHWEEGKQVQKKRDGGSRDYTMNIKINIQKKPIKLTWVVFSTEQTFVTKYFNCGNHVIRKILKNRSKSKKGYLSNFLSWRNPKSATSRANYINGIYSFQTWTHSFSA